MGNLARINHNPSLVHQIARERLFGDRPLVVIDVGTRNGFEAHWHAFNDQAALIGFEPDVHECEALNARDKDQQYHIYPCALGIRKETRTFYRTCHAPSSGFYPVNMAFLDRFPDKRNLAIEGISNIETVDYDTFAREHSIEPAEFIKVDAEGCELDVLRGATETLKRSVLGISVEVCFSPVHKDQVYFSEIDTFLRNLGFHLFDMTVYRHARNALPDLIPNNIPGPTSYGQVQWGQVLYLRDAIADMRTNAASDFFWNANRLLKLASLMETFSLHDCAIETVMAGARKNAFSKKEADMMIDMLTPSLGNRKLTYKERMNQLHRIRKRGYTNARSLAAQTQKFIRRKLPYLIKRSIPKPIRQAWHTILRDVDREDGALTKGTRYRHGMNIGLIATMPRSGTWYNMYLILFYHLLLSGKKGNTHDLAKQWRRVINVRKTIGLDLLYTGHAVCPGFEYYQGPYRTQWDSLQFYVDGYDAGKQFLAEYPGLYDPKDNPDVRIVYLYRNPLDQAVSFFRHSLNSVDEYHLYRRGANDQNIRIVSAADFFHNVGLEAYIKQFLSYKLMREQYPANILMIPYRQQIEDPEGTFIRILKHFKHDTATPFHARCIKEALSLASIDNMKSLENKFGRSLGQDQKYAAERHIRNGSIGLWQDHFTESDLKKAEARLQQFGMSLRDFSVEYNSHG